MNFIDRMYLKYKEPPIIYWSEDLQPCLYGDYHEHWAKILSKLYDYSTLVTCRLKNKH